MASADRGDPWQQLGSEPLLVTPYLEVRRDHVIRPDGQKAAYDFVWMQRGFVVIVPTRARRELLMIRQFRQSVRRDSYEIPAGAMDEDETPEQTARRELREETGWDCHDMVEALTCHPLVGRSNVCCHVLHAPEPVYVGPPTDMYEAQEVFWADQARFAELWRGGQIHAGSSIIGMLLALTLRWLAWDLPDVLGGGGGG